MAKAEVDLTSMAWAAPRQYREQVAAFVEDPAVSRVCEIGGGRSPMLGLDVVREKGLEYTVLDVAQEELDLAPDGYHTLCGDICAPEITAGGPQFDLMISKMVAEHVPDGVTMHRNVFELLNPGGVAFHYFPTLWYPVFVANRYLPEKASTFLLSKGADRHDPKFPAHYSACVGPSPKARKRLEDIGYEIVEYKPFYGSGYLRRLPVVGKADTAVARWAVRHKSVLLASYAFLVLRKPA